MVIPTQEWFLTAGTSQFCLLPGRKWMDEALFSTVMVTSGQARRIALRKRKKESTFPAMKQGSHGGFVSFLFSFLFLPPPPGLIGTFLSSCFSCQWRKLHNKTISDDVTCHIAWHSERSVRTPQFAFSKKELRLLFVSVQGNLPWRQLLEFAALAPSSLLRT